MNQKDSNLFTNSYKKSRMTILNENFQFSKVAGVSFLRRSLKKTFLNF